MEKLTAYNVLLFVEEDQHQNESKNCVEKEVNTDPWPGYRYTGKLRPYYPLVRFFFFFFLQLHVFQQKYPHIT